MSKGNKQTAGDPCWYVSSDSSDLFGLYSASNLEEIF